MTVKEALKERYGNGKGKQAAFHILEIVIAAGIVAFGGILYSTINTIPKVEMRMDAAANRMDKQLGAIKDVDKKISALSDCIQNHVKDFSIHYPHKIVPIERGK